MQAHGLEVRNVVGRYPHGPAVLRSDNIEASIVSAVGTILTLRLEDLAHPEAWVHITVELTPEPDRRDEL